MLLAVMLTFLFNNQANARNIMSVNLQGQTLTDFLSDRKVLRFIRCESSNYNSQFYTGYKEGVREILILQSKDKYNVLVGELKERHYRKLSVASAKILENESELHINFHTHNPFYPRKLEITFDKNSNKGKFFAEETNGIFGILGDSDTFIEVWSFSKCNSHTLPKSFTWADYFYAHSVKFKF